LARASAAVVDSWHETDAGGGIGSQGDRVETGSVAVNRQVEVVRGADLGQDVEIGVEHGRHVHHLGQPEDMRPAQ